MGLALILDCNSISLPQNGSLKYYFKSNGGSASKLKFKVYLLDQYWILTVEKFCITVAQSPPPPQTQKKWFPASFDPARLKSVMLSVPVSQAILYVSIFGCSLAICYRRRFIHEKLFLCNPKLCRSCLSTIQNY